MKQAALTAAAVGVALAASGSVPAAFGYPAPTYRYHYVQSRHARRRAESPAVASASPASHGWAPFPGPFVNPFATPPPPLAWPKIAPYPQGEGGYDGLSRAPDDCNKGCIDGPY